MDKYSTPQFFTIIMDNLPHIQNDIDNTSVAQAILCKPEECYSYISTNKHLIILTQNIRSIYKNFDAFQVTLHSTNIDCDVLVLTECHLSKLKSIPNLNNDYNTYFTENTLNQCDGVVIYVKKDLTHKIVEPYIKNASCLIVILSDTLIIGIYRTPSISNTDEFTSSLQSLLLKYNSYRNIIITGDINIDIKVNTKDSNCSNYLTSLAYHGILPAHRLPTRDKMCYDHMMLKTSYPAKSLVLTNAPTDHSTVILNVMQEPVRRNTLKTKISYNFDVAISDIKIDLDNILTLTDPTEAADVLINKITTAINNNKTIKCVPSRKRHIQPWITPGVLRCLGNRDKLHLKLKKNPFNEILKITYTRYRNYCSKLVRKLKTIYERKKLDSATKNPKLLWKSIKSICNLNKNRNDNAHNLLSLKSSPLESANCANNYFSNVGKRLAEKLLLSPITNHPYTRLNRNPSPLYSFVLLETDPAEVNSIITSLSNNSAPGWDNISTAFIKMAKSVLLPVLCHVYNLCLNTGCFPSVFKKAIVTPIYKSGDKNNIENYRPISVLPVIAKILEKLINNRLKKFLTENSLLSNNQFGFRNGISTEDAVLALSNTICKHLDIRDKCVGVFLDLAKAFDSVSVPMLLNKLYNIGIRGVPHKLLTDYLSNRQQHLKLGEVTSDSSSIAYGVPQGSVLGPTLFLIYVNDLCNITLPNCNIFTYADDTALIFNAKSWENLKIIAESGIQQISIWLRSNLLTLNVTKTKFIPFTIRKSTLPDPEFALKIHSCTQPLMNNCQCEHISRTTTIKYLGVTIDHHLKWNNHIECTVDRIRKLMWAFRKLRYTADNKILTSTYKVLAQSVISYCISVWGGAAKSYLISLERAQRALLKVMFFKPIRFSTYELHSSNKILTTRQIYILNSIIKIHKTLPYTAPLTIRRRNLPVCNEPLYKTKFKKNQFAVQSSHLYNNFNRKLNIYPLTCIEVKNKVIKSLLTCNYEETEQLMF